MFLIYLLRPMLLLGTLAIAAVTDVLKHKISNLLVFTCFAAETAIYVLAALVSEPVTFIAAQPLAYSCCFILLLFILFIFGMTGGADVKLYALCIFTYPDELGLRLIVVSVLLGAAYSLFVLIRYGLLRERMIHLFNFALVLSCGIKPDYMADIKPGCLNRHGSVDIALHSNINQSDGDAAAADNRDSAEYITRQKQAIVPMAVFIYLAACIVLV